MMVGKTIVGLRMDDAIRAVNWLASRPDVDRSKIAVYGNGRLGVVALHAAALDSRMARVVIENSLADYALALNAPLTRNLPEIALDGVLRKYDLGGLMLAIAPRTVAVVNPVDAVGQPLREEAARKELSYALSDRVRIYSALRAKRCRCSRRSAGEREILFAILLDQRFHRVHRRLPAAHISAHVSAAIRTLAPQWGQSVSCGQM